MFRSVLNDIACKHKHALYREARECGYRRDTRLNGHCVGVSHVVDKNGAAISAELGAAADEVAEDQAQQARQAKRSEEIATLKDEIREANKKNWRNL